MARPRMRAHTHRRHRPERRQESNLRLSGEVDRKRDRLAASGDWASEVESRLLKRNTYITRYKTERASSSITSGTLNSIGLHFTIFIHMIQEVVGTTAMIGQSTEIRDGLPVQWDPNVNPA